MLAFDGNNFIDHAYLAILGRLPDEDGRKLYLKQLRSGTSKQAILRLLVDSPEGSAAGAKLDERELRGRRGRLRQIPVIGRAISFVSDLVCMPSTVIDLHRRQIASANAAEETTSDAVDAAFRALSADLVRRLDGIQDNVTWQGEHSRVDLRRQAEQLVNGLNGQIGALSGFVRTELPQASAMSYLTCFMDVRQNRLSMQLATVQQSILDSLRQIADRLEPDFTWLLAALKSMQDSDREAVERSLERVIREVRGSGQELDSNVKESIETSKKAFEAIAAALAGLKQMRLETVAEIGQLEDAVLSKTEQLLGAVAEEGRTHKAAALAGLEEIRAETIAGMVRLEGAVLSKSEQLLEVVAEQGRAQAAAMAGVEEMRVETVTEIGRLEGTVLSKSEQLLEAVAQQGGAQTPAVLESPIRDCMAHMAALRETLSGILAALGELQNRVATTADDVFRNQVGTSVDQLSAAAADFLNWAGGHTGYSAQKNVWINHPFFPIHAHADVSLGYMNERILEIPYVFASAMKLPPGSRILDCGCCENWVGPALAQFGYQVIGVDVRPYPIEAPNFTFVQEALETWDGPAEPVDAILCLSTLEHFGLGAYGGPKSGERMDCVLLAKMAAWLKPSGLLILTAPYGKWSVDEFQRVYDSSALENLLSDWEVQEAHHYYTNDGAVWKRGDKSLDTHPFQNLGRAVVMLQARYAK